MNNPFSMAAPKKRTSSSKKRIRKNIWKKKGYWAALKAFSIGKLQLHFMELLEEACYS
uniref:ribosomal protein L32 n=1 Tax=Selenicereus megalanthus TaxID=1195127 RepID=UPI0030E2AA1D